MKFLRNYFTGFLITILTFGGCGLSIPDPIAEAMDELPNTVDYNLHIKPILSDRCFSCHGNDQHALKAGLRLDLEENAYAELTDHPGKYAIVPHRLGQSELVSRIISDDPEFHMPPLDSNLKLSAKEKAMLLKWVKQGAVYKPHWSFLKPKKANLPNLEDQDWATNEIDFFILKALEEKGWTPADIADKETLLRRVSFDLTGLPPTIEEMDDFLNDESPDAYEQVVNRLLGSPHFGERMAVEWMDVGRYADTHGYTVDRYRDMSPWRDWVINAFNQNMPYDSFATYQLAGDLISNATDQQILATGFNRNHQQNMEGGIIDEEFRVEYVADRTNTLGAAFLGLTLECARCHDHKYDPISHKEYYQMYSFFNNVNEAGQISYDNALPTPTLQLINANVKEKVKQLNEKILEKENRLAQISVEEQERIKSWIQNTTSLSPANYPKNLIAQFSLDGHLRNRISSQQPGKMKQVNSSNLSPVFAAGHTGQGLALDGDAWLDLGKVGKFDRADPFTIAIRVNIPENLSNGVIFHKGIGAALYNFRGYHLAIKDNRLEVLMAYTMPDNAIVEYAAHIPRNEWIQLTMSYNGSGTADGLKIFLNGEELSTEVQVDNLYKDIMFNVSDEVQPGLQIGARWRGIGIKGAAVDDILVFDRALTKLEILQLFNPNTFKHEVNQLPVNEVSSFYLANHSKPYKSDLTELELLRRTKAQTLDTVKEVMVIKEMKTPRQAYILERGQYDAYGESVYPNVINKVLPFSDSFEKNRLGLCRWIFHEDNPLTSRVIVNRYWQLIFGQGLVSTPEDFGSQGASPTHPNLLDWLAVDFLESGWDIKGFIKKLVMSSTYRQSSISNPDIALLDKDNAWYARGPSFRLTAEMLRDNVLAASKLMSKSIGGKSVKPYQPDGLWRMNSGRYVRNEYDKIHRRSLYTFWKRSVPHPTQNTFDAPSRSVCSVKRQKTSTPLQALILMNDPIYLEAANVLGQLISSAQNTETGIIQSFRSLTGRYPHEKELEILKSLHEKELENFNNHPNKMKGWLDVGEEGLNPKYADPLTAANIVVASTIINTDATTYKR